MSLELEPELENRVREYAATEGVSVRELIARAFPPRPEQRQAAMEQVPLLSQSQRSPSPRQAPRLQVLPREQAALLNAPSIQRLEAELAEAANATPEEVSDANTEWQALKQALNDNRRASALDRALETISTGS